MIHNIAARSSSMETTVTSANVNLNTTMHAVQSPISRTTETQLDGGIVQELNQALVCAFTRDELRKMVRYKLGRVLSAIIDDSGDMDTVVFNLIEWAERHGYISDLVLGAAQHNPTNPVLTKFVERHHELLSANNDGERTTVVIVVKGNLSRSDPDSQRAFYEHAINIASLLPDGTAQILGMEPFNSIKLTVELPKSKVLNLLTAASNTYIGNTEVLSISLRKTDLSSSDLQGAYLVNVDLVGANLSRSDLRHADLSGANLSRTNLTSADLSFAKLSKAILVEAMLRDTDFREANLRRADLRSADLTLAKLYRADLTGANLVETVFHMADLSRSSFVDARLSGANLSQATLYKARLRRTILNNGHLEGAYLKGADLSGANLTKAVLTYANLVEAILAETILIEANLAETRLWGADFTGANLQNALLKDADLRGANFDGANLNGVVQDRALTQMAEPQVTKSNEQSVDVLEEKPDHGSSSEHDKSGVLLVSDMGSEDDTLLVTRRRRSGLLLPEEPWSVDLEELKKSARRPRRLIEDMPVEIDQEFIRRPRRARMLIDDPIDNASDEPGESIEESHSEHNNTEIRGEDNTHSAAGKT